MLNKRYTLLIVGISLLTGALITYVMINQNSNVPELISHVYVEKSPDINVNGMLDHNKKPFNRESLLDKWTFIFFGFTNCPDVCPATLTQLSVLDKKLDKSELSITDTQFVLVSVDPQRDKPEHLAEYMRYFNPDFVGVTGEIDMIERFEKQFDAYHRYGKKNTNGFYTVQHSAEVFLINPSGNWIAKFTPPMDLDLMVNQFSMIVKMYSKAAA